MNEDFVLCELDYDACVPQPMVEPIETGDSVSFFNEKVLVPRGLYDSYVETYDKLVSLQDEILLEAITEEDK